MSAMGFGAGVTGGGANPTTFNVRNGHASGTDSLDQAVKDVATLQAGTPGTPARILIAENIRVDQRTDPLAINAKNLTIEGLSGSVIFNNLLQFNASSSDNVILKNLRFEGTPGSNNLPHDSVKIEAQSGRGPVGFWIDHCRFEAVKDLSITTNTKDLVNAPPLRISISSCYFLNADPDGNDHRDNGALGIHGYRNDNDSTNQDRDMSTNAYASVYRNFFKTVRRRSPRSSNLTVVHAFNNVLRKWGAKNTTDQVNGMESGNFGVLIAEANYFDAGPVKEAITVAGGNAPGTLTVHQNDDRLKNRYFNTDVKATPVGTQVDINGVYMAMNIAVPNVQKMTEELMSEIESQAGPQY